MKKSILLTSIGSVLVLLGASACSGTDGLAPEGDALEGAQPSAGPLGLGKVVPARSASDYAEKYIPFGPTYTWANSTILNKDLANWNTSWCVYMGLYGKFANTGGRLATSSPGTAPLAPEGTSRMHFPSGRYLLSNEAKDGGNGRSYAVCFPAAGFDRKPINGNPLFQSQHDHRFGSTSYSSPANSALPQAYSTISQVTMPPNRIYFLNGFIGKFGRGVHANSLYNSSYAESTQGGYVSWQTDQRAYMPWYLTSQAFVSQIDVINPNLPNQSSCPGGVSPGLWRDATPSNARDAADGDNCTPFTQDVYTGQSGYNIQYLSRMPYTSCGIQEMTTQPTSTATQAYISWGYAPPPATQTPRWAAVQSGGANWISSRCANLIQ